MCLKLSTQTQALCSALPAPAFRVHLRCCCPGAMCVFLRCDRCRLCQLLQVTLCLT